ncbi:ABC transporter permease [Demequina sp. SO4-13]|uniref:ABC transporter permease n=1 Tax=Demequina sp. SO4-13 TaxID=3401027 RepID=UPI003AF74F2C
MTLTPERPDSRAAEQAPPVAPLLPTDARLARTLSKQVRIAGRGFWKQPLAVFGVIILAAWLVVGVFAPWIVPFDPLAQDSARFLPPGGEHVMGTDALGRDVFSRVLTGVQITVPYAVIIVIVSTLIALIVGAVAAYAGGWIDEVLMRTTDIFLALPSIVLAMVVAAAIGPGLGNAVIAIIIVAWPPMTRIVRSLVLSIRSRDYVTSSRLLGASSSRTLVVDFGPNLTGSVVVVAMIEISQRILLLAALSFLGLGAQEPTPEWGRMVSDGAAILDRWWVATFPGLAILTVVLAFNLIGDTLRDSLDPQVSRQMKG